jgi:hypothetical protein
MSVFNKSDVQKHLSTHAGATAAGNAGGNADETHTKYGPEVVAAEHEKPASPAAEVETAPLHLIGEEPVANAQVGGSVGVPASEPWQPRKL